MNFRNGIGSGSAHVENLLVAGDQFVEVGTDGGWIDENEFFLVELLVPWDLFDPFAQRHSWNLLRH